MTAIIASCNSVKYSSKLAYVFEKTTPFLQPVTDGQYNSLIIWKSGASGLFRSGYYYSSLCAKEVSISEFFIEIVTANPNQVLKIFLPN